MQGYYLQTTLASESSPTQTPALRGPSGCLVSLNKNSNNEFSFRAPQYGCAKTQKTKQKKQKKKS